MSYCPYPFNTLAIKSSNSNPQKMLVAPCCNVKPINRKEVDITSNTIHNFSETFGDLIHSLFDLITIIIYYHENTKEIFLQSTIFNLLVYK